MTDTMITELMDVEAYTKKGVFLGHIKNLIIDVEECKVESLFIEETNPTLVEDSMSVAVPYRWVQSVGDVVILKYFPEGVTVSEKKDESEDQ